MSKVSKKFFVLALAGALIVSASDAAFAAEGENSLTGFFRRLFNYPAKTAEKTGEMTANTLNNTGEKVIAKTAENTSEILQGQVQETGNLAGDLVTGTAETVGQTASETVQVPAEAAAATE